MEDRLVLARPILLNSRLAQRVNLEQKVKELPLEPLWLAPRF